jgi:hypothetical protein
MSEQQPAHDTMPSSEGSPVITEAQGIPLGRLAGGPAAVVAGVLLILGAVLPWVAGPDAAQVATGLVLHDDGSGELGTRVGLAGGDGVVFVLVGVVAVLVGVLVLVDRLRYWQRAALIGGGLLSLAWVLLDAGELGTVVGDDGTALSLSAGVGAYVTGLGAVLCLFAALTIPRDPLHRTMAMADRALRLENGHIEDAIEELQRSLDRGKRAVPGSPVLLGYYAALAELQSQDSGEGAAAAANQTLQWYTTEIEQAFADDPHLLIEHRLLGLLAMQSANPAWVPSYAEWISSDALNKLAPDDPLLISVRQTTMAARDIRTPPPPYQG